MEEERDVQTPGPEGEAAAAPRQGRRLAADDKGGKGKKLALVIVAVVAAVLLAAYLGLCAYASGERILPGTRMAGVDVGGMTAQEAANAVADATAGRYDAMEIPIAVDGRTVTLAAKDAQVHINAETALQRLRERPRPGFLAAGGKYLAGLMGADTEVPLIPVIGNENYVNQVLDDAASHLGDGVVETTWEVEEDEESARLVLKRGQTGQGIDKTLLFEQVRLALEEGITEPITAQVVTTAPQEPDFSAMAEEVDREPLDATLDMETDEVIPHRLGLKLDSGKAKALYDTLAEGESGKVELEVTQPEVTTLELRSTLFRDILGEGSSKISGDANRVNNVKLSAMACDGVVLLPGQQMSYNQTTGQRTTAKGYRPASGYTAGGVVDMVGGGVCQPSSTLYMACLNANLEIVNRKNHMYTVSYMPEGIDATVSWPNLDYVFANNTKYPIKISMTIEKGTLTARIYGTKTDDNYVKMESVRLSTTPAGVSYRADPTLPQGTTKVVQGAHTGKKVEVYKNIYAADGTLLSRQWVSTDTYRASDKIIAYNPLDGVPGVIDPVAPGDLPADPSVTPSTPPAGPSLDPSAPPADSTVAPSAPPAADPSVVPSTPPVDPTVAPTEPPAAPSVPPTAPPVDLSLIPTQAPEGIPAD